ncbi:hypothetical protein OCK74_15615 [Chitinophagaceae bacterium LB-8]|jgi:uncharacterized protein DUF6702|uniref:Uncharacterized protein n=1 Tax=Paraflavisolibacter caeni TaxID=2982496 RepID=A0A9X2XXG2_9BACT|nr:DUF6702 family protein [Paraflavisolibacter caeni]MCU7550546.1 hypothetical protein [Paraflavisolibacter caeni]
MALLLYKWLISMSLFTVTFFPSHSVAATGQVSKQDIYHPFYVSVTEISHNKQEKSLEISCKIFADDMEGILKQTYKKAIDLSDEKKRAENGSYIADYIKKHLKISADGIVLKLNYVGYEKDNEAAFCYFEAVQIPSVKKLDVENSILHDFTDQQINIMHVTVNGKRQSYKLDYPNQKASFSF